MAITVTDQRAILNECDSTTGWTGASGTTSSEPTPVEATLCITDVISNATSRAYYTDGTGWDMSAGLVYIWFTHRAALATTASGGIRFVIGDGTNRIEYYIAGEDKAGFRHDDGPAGWQCYVMDSESPPTSFLTAAGSEASLDWSAITQIGIGGTTLAKAVGGAVNFFIDIARFGDTGEGLQISGGTSGTPSTFAELAAADRSVGNQQAHGIFRELSSGVYGIQGPLQFGATSTADGYLQGDDEVLVYEARDLLDDKYFLTVIGDTTYVTSFVLNSCIIKSAAHGVECDFTDANIDTLTIDACTFADLQNTISFTNTAAATGHDVTSTVFTGCGQIDPGDVTFTGNTVANTTDATGGLLIDADGTSNISGISFISDGTGHAIYITAAGSYTLTNFTYSGYAIQTGTEADRAVYNNSGGVVNLTISGGDIPSYRNGTSATTNIITGAVTLSVHVVDTAGADVENARVILKASDGTGPFPYKDAITSITRSGTTATVTTTAIHGMATDDYVSIKGCTNLEALNGVKQITVTSTTTFTYTVPDAGATSGLGTMVVTFVALYGLSSAAGIVTTSRSYSNDQPILGWARKSSATPYYKQAPLSGIVDSGTGYSATALMVLDE